MAETINIQTTLEDASFQVEVLKDLIPEFPDLDLTHIQRLTNQVGILQHAKYAIPDYHHGYCQDDNARALILATCAHEMEPSAWTEDLIATYLAYMHYMQLDNGSFRNFLSFDHQFLDEVGTEDSYGRTIWALGHFINLMPQSAFAPLASEMFHRALPHAERLRSVRAVGYALLGLIAYYEGFPEEWEVKRVIKNLSGFLRDEYQQCATVNWPWYEQIIAYDNAIIPLAVLRASEVLQDDHLQKIGYESTQFLDSLLFENEYLSTIGNKGWYPKDGTKSVYGQQPIEVPSIILLYKQLYTMTDKRKYADRMLTAFRWFFGLNKLKLQLFDPQTKGCSDGLDSHGVNLNQGAESALSFWLAYLYICTPYR